MAATSSSIIRALEPRALGALPSEPLVSILLANYNYANYIEESVESVLKQSYRNWELIICDDGSTDNSVLLIERYVSSDPRIQLVRKRNGGHTSALNAAFSPCRGDIICFLDSDDLYAAEKLEVLVDACARFPQAGFISHRIVRINKQRQRQGVWPLSDIPDGWLGPDLLRLGGILPYAPPTSGISLRREIADLLFPLSIEPPLHTCPDQIVVRLAPLLTAIKRMPQALAEYRLHDANTYAKQSFTAESVTKELTFSTALWQEQHRFLSKLDPDIAGLLSAFENGPYSGQLRYLQAKLRDDPAARKYQQNYLEIRKRVGDTKFSLFWRLSIYIPGILFRPLVGLLFGNGALKQFIARLKKLA